MQDFVIVSNWHKIALKRNFNKFNSFYIIKDGVTYVHKAKTKGRD